MKNLVVMALTILALVAAKGAAADDTIFDASVGMTAATGSQEAPGRAIVYGTVTLSAKGEVRILWNGVSLALGSYTVGETGQGRNFVSVNLPTLYLDLQQVFGVHWMDSVRLSLASGSYDDSPIEGKTDVTLGQIGVNLTQSVAKTSGMQWTLSEGVNTNYFQRQMYESDQVFEAVPVNFTVNSQLVDKISQQAVVAISMGAYASIVNGINQNEGFRSIVAGAQLTPSIAIGGRLTIGAHLDAAHMEVVAGGSKTGTAINASAFVKYVLSQSHGQPTQALELSVATVEDGMVLNVNGDDTRATLFGLKYSLVF